ncbi:MAG: lysylphosphatidylglycerol synthase transmembrane domain-containing protein [Candidatus Nealsonbacteria bacterium]
MNINRIKNILIFLVLLFLGFVLFYFVIEWVGWAEIKEILFTFSGYKGIVILILSILIWLAGLLRWEFVLKSFGYKFSQLGLFEIYFASYTLNYFFSPPVYFGDELFRLYATKKKFSIEQDKNLATIAIEKVLSASILLLFLVFGAISFIFLVKVPFKNFGLISLSVIGVLSVALFLFYFRSFNKKSIFNIFFKIFGIKNKRNQEIFNNIEEEIFRFFDFKKSLMWKGLTVAFSRYFFIFARCWFLIYFLTGGTGILIPIVVLLFLFLATVLPFPARIGGLELTQAFAFGVLGMGTAVGITFSFIIRGAEMLIALFGLVLFIRLGIKFSHQGIENITNNTKTKKR